MRINKWMEQRGSIALVFGVILSQPGCAGRNIALLPPCVNKIETQAHCRVNDSYAHLPCNKETIITCKPLMLTDIRLVSGEQVLSLNAGDTGRWLFQTILSYADNEPVIHLLLKPKENAIKTNVVIATNQRTYHLHLISDENANTRDYFGFYDPQQITNRIGCHCLDANYELKVPFLQQTPLWVPHSIYNDGVSVYIGIPKLKRYAAPTFYVLDENNQPTLVNYHIQNNGYRVDQLFAKGMLIKGAGRTQQKVIIHYLGHLQG
jgi:type IV secretion system protein TrbG